MSVKLSLRYLNHNPCPLHLTRTLYLYSDHHAKGGLGYHLEFLIMPNHDTLTIIFILFFKFDDYNNEEEI